jgi:hypothetical protein
VAALRQYLACVRLGAEMEKLKGQLVLDLMEGEISEETFVSRFGADPRVSPDVVHEELQQALVEKSELGVECALILGFIFGLSPSWAPILCLLLEEDWHFSHEDIADALQNIRPSSAVDSLYRAALKKHDYLAYDESSALAVKCIWALHDIGTEEAIAKLKSLLELESETIRENARHRLSDLSAKRPGEPEPSYRRARNKLLRPDGR